MICVKGTELELNSVFDSTPEPKQIHYYLLGLMHKDEKKFCGHLLELLVSDTLTYITSSNLSTNL